MGARKAPTHERVWATPLGDRPESSLLLFGAAFEAQDRVAVHRLHFIPIEFASQLPSRDKLFGLREKYLLMRAFNDLVPEAVLNRPKQPYRSPDASAFFGAGAPDWVTELTSPEAVAEAGVFDPARVGGLVAKCVRTGGQNLGNTDCMRVLAVLSTQLIHQQFIAADGAQLPSATSQEPTVAVDFVEHNDRSTK